MLHLLLLQHLLLLLLLLLKLVHHCHLLRLVKGDRASSTLRRSPAGPYGQGFGLPRL